jgi:ABC-type glycerol-3-phosphate transport system substrate-binding protein
MARSMAVRRLLAAALLLVLAGCGGSEPASRELRLVAPADLVEAVPSFERATGCRVEVRVYDEGEDLAAIVRRRDADVVAEPVRSVAEADDVVSLAEVKVGGVTVRIPVSLAPAFGGPVKPAGRRLTRWTIRDEGDNDECARRWIAYAR